MKKKLEADLISIAHRILKLKNKSELVQLHQETQKLYEKLSVLLFVEENFGEVKPTIGLAEIEKKLESIDNKQLKENAIEVSAKTVNEEESEPEGEVISEVIEKAELNESEEEQAVIEEIEKATAAEEPEVIAPKVEVIIEEETAVETDAVFKPAFELAFETKTEEIKEERTSKSSQISFEDLLGPSYTDPVFVKPEELIKENEVEQKSIPEERQFLSATQFISNYKTDAENRVTLNDRLSKGVTIGLNDRMAFIKHLFADSTEDYNRVLNQLITFGTIHEVQSFINDMVKPDYNNWDGKDEYAERFMDILEKKFS